MRKITRKFMAIITMLSIFAVTFVQALPASAATMHSIYYTAGDVDNMVSASTFTFAVPEGCSFEYCAASRFSRKGYKITSWYVQETGETVGLTQPSFMPTYDLHVTANWEPVTYNICLAGVGGVTAAGEENIYVDGTYGTTIDLPYNPFTKDGYTFAGWEYNGTRYAEGSAFEVPAVISGGRIVLAAAWNKVEAVVTETPVQEITTTTTTTTAMAEATTEAPAEEGMKVNYFYPDKTFGSVNDSFKIYISDILGRYDSLESVEFTFETDEEKLGSVSVGFATQLSNGETYQQNFAEYVNEDVFTMTIDKDICSQLSYGRFFQFVCWHSDSLPLELYKVKTVVKENAYTTTTEEEEEEEITTTTTTEITTEETTTTTTTTTEATTEETTTTTTTTTEATTEETTTTTTTTEITTEEITTTETTTEETQPTTEEKIEEAINDIVQEYINMTMKGDADLDGEVSLTDVIVVSKNIVNKASYPFKSYTAFANADMNGDYEVNGIDTSALIEFNLGK